MKQQIIGSRMFGKPVTDPDPATVEHVLSVYAQRATARMRRDRSVAGMVSAFAASSPYADGYTSAWGQAVFAMPTDDPVTIAKAAAEALREKLRAGVKYVPAGVMLGDLTPASSHSYLPMFQPTYDHRGVGDLLDRVHRRHGETAIGLGLAGVPQAPASRCTARCSRRDALLTGASSPQRVQSDRCNRTVSSRSEAFPDPSQRAARCATQLSVLEVAEQVIFSYEGDRQSSSGEGTKDTGEDHPDRNRQDQRLHVTRRRQAKHG